MTAPSVKGHLLPDDLAAMLAGGGWGPGVRPGNPGALPIVDGDDLALLSLPQILANTDALGAALDRGEGTLLRLTREHPAPPGWLDVGRAVMIAVTHGQEAVVLDYSRPGAPRVVATSDEPGGLRWVEVAASFADLAALIALPAATGE